MTNTLQVLAQMASDASIQQPQDIEQLLTEHNIDAATSAAIIAKDVTSLERQLDVRPDIVCFVVPAEDEDSEEKDDAGSTEESSQLAIGF